MCICGIWSSKHKSDTPTAEGSADKNINSHHKNNDDDDDDDDNNPPTPPLSACQNYARYSKYHKYTQIPILRNTVAA